MISTSLIFSKEEVQYLVHAMVTLEDESSGYRDEFRQMLNKLDGYCRSNFNSFISLTGEIVDVSYEQSVKLNAEQEARQLVLAEHAAKFNLGQASSAIYRLKSRLNELLDLDGISVRSLTRDMIEYIEHDIVNQWNYIFEGYSKMNNIISIHIDESLAPSQYVVCSLSDSELDAIFFPKQLLDEIDNIRVL